MRKYIIGIAVGLVFLAYSFVLRHHHSGPVVLAPKNTTSNTAPSGSSTSSSNTGSSTSSSTQSASYKDGSYTGSVANAYYGNIQVAVNISGGKITGINFLQAPNDNPNSQYINQQADPYLKQEAIQSQSSHVSIVTGATLSSEAFIQSLSNALNQAKG